MDTSQLYLITPPHLAIDSFCQTLEQILQAVPVACLQLRLKPLQEEMVISYGQKIKKITDHFGTSLIINDRPDLAKKLNADGVHIGQKDMDYAKSRKLLGPNKMIGVTCHASKDLAYQAAEAGADYVAFGAFFPSATKPKPEGQATLELIKDWHLTTTTPCVAIGGITTENCLPLIEAGADFLAVSNGLWNHPEGAVHAAKKFNFIFRQYK